MLAFVGKCARVDNYYLPEDYSSSQSIFSELCYSRDETGSDHEKSLVAIRHDQCAKPLDSLEFLIRYNLDEMILGDLGGISGS